MVITWPLNTYFRPKYVFKVNTRIWGPEIRMCLLPHCILYALCRLVTWPLNTYLRSRHVCTCFHIANYTPFAVLRRSQYPIAHTPFIWFYFAIRMYLLPRSILYALCRLVTWPLNTYLRSRHTHVPTSTFHTIRPLSSWDVASTP